MNKNITAYKGHRFPEAVISHGVWRYYRFSLSFREVEELLAARGVVVSYETIRQWCLKFPSTYAKKLRKTGINPRKIVTDKLRSYRAALKQMSLATPHVTDRYENNRAELSHQPTRQRERKMQRFKSSRQAQRFLSFHGVVNNLFRLQRHLMSAKNYRAFRDRAFAIWQRDTCACWPGLT